MITKRIGWGTLLGIAGFGLFVFTESYVLTMPIIAFALTIVLEKSLLRAAELAASLTAGFLIYLVAAWALYGILLPKTSDGTIHNLGRMIEDYGIVLVVAGVCTIVAIICNYYVREGQSPRLRRSKIKRYQRS